MKAFVTGSTGLLGNNLVRHLVERGYEVKAMARNLDKAETLLGDVPNVTFVQGDMENIDGFAAEMADCDVLFHTAAYFREYFGKGDHWTKLEAINVSGTIKLLEAAEQQGVKKVIYTSSSGVIGKTPDGSPGDESTAPDDEIMKNLYFRSKAIAEEAIAQFLKTHDLPVVLILPAAIFGPGDAAPTSAGQMVIDFLNQDLPAIPPGGFCVVDVRDVAKGMVDAVEHGKRGERYIISDRYYSLAEIMSIISEISGIAAPGMRLTPFMAMNYARVSEWIARITGSEPQVTVNAVRTLTTRRDVMMDKAKRELGSTLRPFEETLRDEVQWYLDKGYVGSGQIVTPSLTLESS